MSEHARRPSLGERVADLAGLPHRRGAPRSQPAARWRPARGMRRAGGRQWRCRPQCRRRRTGRRGRRRDLREGLGGGRDDRVLGWRGPHLCQLPHAGRRHRRPAPRRPRLHGPGRLSHGVRPRVPAPGPRPRRPQQARGLLRPGRRGHVPPGGRGIRAHGGAVEDVGRSGLPRLLRVRGEQGHPWSRAAGGGHGRRDRQRRPSSSDSWLHFCAHGGARCASATGSSTSSSKTEPYAARSSTTARPAAR